MRRLTAAVIALASLATLSPLHAQKKGAVPKRPKLDPEIRVAAQTFDRAAAILGGR